MYPYTRSGGNEAMKFVVVAVVIYLVVGLLYSVSSYVRDRRYVSDLGTRGLLGIGFSEAAAMLLFWPYFIFLFRGLPGNQREPTSAKSVTPRAMRASGTGPETSAIQCATCRKSFEWREAYWQKHTPGVRDSMAGNIFPRTFCPRCGSIVLECDPTSNEWHWVEGNESGNGGKPFPPDSILRGPGDDWWWDRRLPDIAVVPITKNVLDLSLLKPKELPILQPTRGPIREVHLFIENGGNDRLVREIMESLHPDLCLIEGLRITAHEVSGWVDDPFAYASATLACTGIRLTTDNCLIGEGSAYGKRIYRVLLK
jgi:hypothetical protein